MAKYKRCDYSQGKFILIALDKQILPGTFEYTLHYLIDNEIGGNGKPVYDSSILLKIVLYAYSRTITSSRTRGQGLHEECCFHGPVCRCSATLHDHRRFHLPNKTGKPRNSNVADNESAKMKSPTV
jgi:hypothetical protein